MSNGSQRRLTTRRTTSKPDPILRHTDGNNYRVATCLDIEENETTYLVTTRLAGLDTSDLNVDVQGDYLIIEGRLLKDGSGRSGYGRYVRHLPLPQPVSSEYIESTLHSDGLLQVRLWKLPTNDA